MPLAPPDAGRGAAPSLIAWPESLNPYLDLDQSIAGLPSPAMQAGHYRDLIQSVSHALERAFADDVPADDLVHGRAAFVDRLLRHIWADTGLMEQSEIGLFAVGGYGRGELLPASDVDLLLLTPDAATENQQGSIAEFLRRLWDSGLHVGHSVRTLDECISEATRDITVVTNLMEARRLDGSDALFSTLMEAIGPDRIWPSREFFAAKLTEQSRRHQKFGDTAYRLEPNVKDGPGGLRDIQMIGWVSKRHLGARRMSDLVRHGFLTEDEYRELKAGQSYLWRIRFALHTLTGRAEERLLFDQQVALARICHFSDEDNNLAVEQFMQGYYRVVMNLERLNEMLLQHYRECILHADDTCVPEPINDRFQVRLNFVEVRHDAVFREYPPALLEIFLLCAQHPQIEGVRAATIRLIRQHRHLIDDAFRHDPICRNLFMQILREPRGVTQQLRRMNRYGILAAYLPAFGSIVGRMQYDLFHVYTVDEHTLMVLRNVRRFSLAQVAGDSPRYHEIFNAQPKPELLYLGALFHDIGKGRGGDHSHIGSVEAEDFCKLHGLSDTDGELVSWLVRNHLLMSMTAQRKDISDPEIVHEFAQLVGTQLHLDSLYLLTIADIRATNPELWNAWRETLLADLYAATTHELARGLDTSRDHTAIITAVQQESLSRLLRLDFSAETAQKLWGDLSDDYFLRHSADEVAWHTAAILENEERPVIRIRRTTERGGSEIFIYAHNTTHLFAHITSALDGLGLDIVDARITTARHGWVLDSFMVLEGDGTTVDDGFRAQEIVHRLRTTLTQLNRPPEQVRRRMPRRLKHFDIPPRISFSHDAPRHWTALGIDTNDRPGLLSAVSQAMADHGVRIHNAKISTIGEQASDVFYVTTMDGDPIDDPAAQESIRTAMIDALHALDHHAPKTSAL
ncbi:[protein-PII] uridylyltransferase [Acidihalobacter aeolianus]|uniref:[protein-PII] uridylyltransferase n=1 Tax=Acidihalobacter aeolianus TaxID=2792603 RepID=UPI0009F4B494